LDFTQGFFAVGGFEMLTAASESAAELAQSAADSGAPACVICGTDADYGAFVPEFVSALRAIKPDCVVVLAGYPQGQVEAYQAAGVDDFIYFGADVLAFNGWLQGKLGVG